MEGGGKRWKSIKVPLETYERLLALKRSRWEPLYAVIEELLECRWKTVEHGGTGSTEPHPGRSVPTQVEGGGSRSTQAGGKGPTRARRVVRWLRKRLQDPERYFSAVAEREGDRVLWVEKGPGVYCYAPESEARAIVEQANREGVEPAEAAGPLRELADCGIAYHDPRKGWQLA